MSVWSREREREREIGHDHRADGFFKCLIMLVVPNVFKVVPPRLILDYYKW